MRTVTAMDMRKRLGEILDAASAGERILIERDHRPLAYLVSVEEGEQLVPTATVVIASGGWPRWIGWTNSATRCGEKYPPPDDGLTRRRVDSSMDREQRDEPDRRRPLGGLER